MRVGQHWTSLSWSAPRAQEILKKGVRCSNDKSKFFNEMSCSSTLKYDGRACTVVLSSLVDFCYSISTTRAVRDYEQVGRVVQKQYFDRCWPFQNIEFTSVYEAPGSKSYEQLLSRFVPGLFALLTRACCTLTGECGQVLDIRQPWSSTLPD